MSSRKQLVVDCDPGVDDAWALLIALADKDVDVVAITAVFGNGTQEETQMNILRTLTVCERQEVAVYPGCEKNLNGDDPAKDGYWGDDALGDIGKYPNDGATLKDEPAHEALVRLANEKKGQLTLVAIGPLTNVARAHQHAVKTGNDFGKNLKEVFIMGGNALEEGNAGEVHTDGNQKAEYNFFNDPKAAHIVLNDIDSEITLVPLDVCYKVFFKWDWYDDFMKADTKEAKFLKDVEAKTVEKSKQNKNKPGYRCFDQHAIVAALDNKYITEKCNITHCSVQLKSNKSIIIMCCLKGEPDDQTIFPGCLKWSKSLDVEEKERSKWLVRSIDQPKLKEKLLAAINGTD